MSAVAPPRPSHAGRRYGPAAVLALAGAVLLAGFALRESHSAMGIAAALLGLAAVAGGVVWMNAALRRERDSLLQQIEKRLSMAHEAEERESQLMEAHRLEAIGRLAGGAAHDFNNLLTVINGCTRFALDAIQQGHPARPEIEEIRRSAERAGRLTHQLLAFSRRQVLEAVVVDLNRLVREAVGMIRRLIGEDIAMQTELDPALPPTVVDPGQIEQVLMNLVVNARDAMPSGGRLTIRTARVQLGEDYVETHIEVPAGTYAMLSVADTGIGMGEAIRERIFEPFFTTKGPDRGTGLGLSTVYGIVKQSGGSIWVYSEPGEGTTFKLYFPATDDAAAAPATGQATGISDKATPAIALSDVQAGGAAAAATEPVAMAAVPASPTLPAHEPAAPADGATEGTVLLVEDDPSVRRLARRALERGGYQVLEAPEPATALAMVDAGSAFDLLLTDMIMPGMNGRELARCVAARRCDARVLLMSGYTAGAVMGDAGELAPPNGIEFIEKPFTPADLVRRVREVMAP